MHEIIDNRVSKSDPLINGLFVSKSTVYKAPELPKKERFESVINNVLQGYGFIEYFPQNLFFHFSDVSGDADFNELRQGDRVSFTIEPGSKGRDVAKNVMRIDSTK